MKTLTLMFLLCPALLMAEPRPPLQMKLDAQVIQTIPIHPEMDTLLMFPKEVTMILGQGLTRGKHPGKVHCQQAENPKIVVLRQLEKGSNVLLQVVMGEEAYVFRLTGSETPASVIRFHSGEQEKTARELSKEEVSKTKRAVSEARMKELIRLTKMETSLRPQLPKEYAGFQSKKEPMPFRKEGTCSTEIVTIGRFSHEDALVFLGWIQNDHPTKALHFKEITVQLQVAGKRVYSPSILLTNRRNQRLSPGEKASLEGVLIGDGKGGELHLSLKNQFALKVQR